MTDGRIQVEQSVAWIRSHKAAFIALQKFCLDIEGMKKSDGSPRYRSITRSSVYMLAEMHGISVSNDMTFRRNNNLWSTLSRYMTEYHPELRRVIRHRDESEVGRYVRRYGLPKLHYTFKYDKNRVA